MGSEIERIYSLEITRGGETTDITDTFPITDIGPGESAIIFHNAEIDVCQGGDGAFDTEAAFVTGPPCDVEVVIACESEMGDECRELPQADTPDDCLIDITYTYTVTNIGDGTLQGTRNRFFCLCQAANQLLLVCAPSGCQYHSLYQNPQWRVSGFD